MKLELSIADDKELRAVVKDMIRGEVVSVARSEIKSILADVLKEGVLPKDSKDLEKLIKEEIAKYVRRALTENNGWGESFVKKEAKDQVNLILRELLNKASLI